jgi:hypothetical protein
MKMENREMAGTDELHRAIGGGAPDDEGGELPGECAFAEDAAGVFDHAIEGEARFGEGAKGGVEMAHEHGSGDAFTGNIAKQEEQAAAGLKEVAIIAADHARGLIVVVDLPAGGGEIGFGQEGALNAGGQGKIAFEGALLGAGQMVEAETRERVGEQALRLNAVVADFANAEGALLDATEGGVDLLE